MPLQELDEAARRRMVKRLYIPLPDSAARRTLVQRLMSSQPHTLDDKDLDEVCAATEGYSGADMKALCTEAAMGPIRGIKDIRSITAQRFFV
jgi:SpoVK/Ycf46/Vps4 family AAA+-type ATPase